MRTPRAALSVAAGIVGLVALGACTGGSSGSSESAAGASAAAGGGSAIRGAASAGSAVGAPAKAPAPDDAQSSSLVAAGTRIRTAELVVSVPARLVARRADAADAVALRAGGEVDADDRTTGRDAGADLLLRVPPARLTPTLTALARLGTERSRQLSSVDVTTKVADVTSRVSSAEGAIARLRTLFADAHKVSDVIDVESELSAREADLESLQAQQRSLARQTSLATVHLTLEAARAAAKKKPHQAARAAGFVRGLENGWHALVVAVRWVVTVVGAVLPFAAVGAVLGGLALALVRRMRRRRTVEPVGDGAPG